MARRKRKDPDEAPIDGDYRQDHVLNKDPSKAYALVHQDDMPKMAGRGYRRTVRPAEASERETSARPAYDFNTEGDYVVGGQLVLMEAPKERAEAIQRSSERNFAAQFGVEQEKIDNFVAANPGSKFSRSRSANAQA